MPACGSRAPPKPTSRSRLSGLAWRHRVLAGHRSKRGWQVGRATRPRRGARAGRRLRRACRRRRDPAASRRCWRQRSTEHIVRRALRLQAEGRHLMLCGDPVAPGELLAAPSADALEAVEVCLLDCRPDVQRERLRERGDPPETVPHHLAFAEWMRGHARDPAWRPEVITHSGWKEMRWDRWSRLRRGDPAWRFTVLDTSDRTVEGVARELLAWVRRAVAKPGGGRYDF
jgi:hypothetical protein